MKILVTIRDKDDLVYFRIEKYDYGRAITRVSYINWEFNKSVEKFERYIGTTSEIKNLAKFLEGLKL